MKSGNRRWKVLLEYEIGILVLVVSILLALFGPDLYASWQDEHMEGQITVSERETIRFLDVDSLDIAGRMSLLKDAERLDWIENSAGNMYVEAILKRANRLAKQWVDSEVLPGEILEILPDSVGQLETDKEKREFMGGSYSILVGQNALNVMMLCCACVDVEGGADIYEEQYGYTADQLDVVVIVMDMDRDLFYYVGVFGHSVWDWMAQQLVTEEWPGAYGSFEMLRELYYDHNGLPKLRLDGSGDLAAVCGALDVKRLEPKEEATGGGLYTDYTLSYEKFDGFAREQLAFFDDIGYGMTYTLGTLCWNDFILEVFNYFNEGMEYQSVIRPGSVEGWVVDPFDDWYTGIAVDSVPKNAAVETETEALEEQYEKK